MGGTQTDIWSGGGIQTAFASRATIILITGSATPAIASIEGVWNANSIGAVRGPFARLTILRVTKGHITSTIVAAEIGGVRITIAVFTRIEYAVATTAVCMVYLLEERTATAALPLHTGACIALIGGRRWNIHVNIANFGTRFNTVAA